MSSPDVSMPPHRYRATRGGDPEPATSPSSTDTNLDLFRPTPTFKEGYHVTFYMPGDEVCAETVSEGLIIGVDQQKYSGWEDSKLYYTIFVAVYYGKSEGLFLSLDSSDEWITVGYKLKKSDKWSLRHARLYQSFFEQSAAEVISDIRATLRRANGA